jgi:hypothetical protein
MLSGRADATDPVCDKSPDHGLALRAITASGDGAAPPLSERFGSGAA